jgi:carbon storage regulator
MLVLTRRPNQSIMIGDEIELTILSIAHGKVRIGVNAPRDIPVFRGEIYLERLARGDEVDADDDGAAARQSFGQPVRQ